MLARLSAFLVWLLVAASATFWGLRLFVTAPAAPAQTLAVADSAPAGAELDRLLGAAPVEASPSVQVPAASSRFQLTGVMAPRTAGGPGIALLTVDGKMPRAFQVGARVDGEMVLQSVSLRSASIGPAQGAPAIVLELPPLPAPATGVMPPAASGELPAAEPVPPVVAPPSPVAPAAAPVPPRRARGPAVGQGNMQRQSTAVQ